MSNKIYLPIGAKISRWNLQCDAKLCVTAHLLGQEVGLLHQRVRLDYVGFELTEGAAEHFVSILRPLLDSHLRRYRGARRQTARPKRIKRSIWSIRCRRGKDVTQVLELPLVLLPLFFQRD